MHKAILAHHSVYFKKLFTSNFSDPANAAIELRSHHPQLVEIMLRRMYNEWKLDDKTLIASITYKHTEALQLALQLVYLADEFRYTNLENDALHLLEVHAGCSKPEVWAETCKKAFNGREERACDQKLRSTIQSICVNERWDDSFMTNESFRDMLRKVPSVAAEVAFAFYSDDAPSPYKHYLQARCNGKGCRAKGKSWFFKCWPKVWSGDVHCIFCGEQEVMIALAEDKTWNSRSVEETCHVCNGSYMFSTDLDLLDMRCLHCGTV